jgi:MFS family permease
MSTPDSLSRPTAPTLRTAGRGWPILVLVIVFAAHSVQAVRLFPTLGSIVEQRSPVIVVDHAIHEYHGSLGARFFRETGTTWGYDPYFMAGYPETPVWDSSSNPSILFDLIGGNQGYRAYKVGLLVCLFLLLAAITAGAWASGLGATEIAVATVLAWLVFWIGFPIALWRSGLFAFLMASAGVGLLLGLCSRFDRNPTRANWLALTIVGAGLFFFHVMTPILSIGGLLAFYFHAVVARRHGWRWHAAIVGAGFLAVAANLPWLISLWKFRGLRVGTGLFMTTNSPLYMVRHFLSTSLDGRIGLTLLVLGLPGLVVWWFGGRKASALAFGGSILAVLSLATFGSLWAPTKTLEPLRFLVPLLFLLACPAASTVVGASRGIARSVGGGGRGRLAAGLAWVAVLGSWLAVERPLFVACWGYLKHNRPLVVGIKPEMRDLVEWLRAKTDLSARILFEDQLRLLETTDAESVHWTPLLPDLLGDDSRMFVGGLYQTAFIQHHRMAAFGDFQLGDRPIDEWKPTEVDEYCRTYNVGWVVCWSPLSRFWFDRYASAKRVATLPRYTTPDYPPSDNEHERVAMIKRAGREVARRYLLEAGRTYAIYRVDRPHSYFLKGKGRVVSVAPNRVELADVEPEGGEVIVSLHWIDTWRADPPLNLRPEPALPDPVGFVGIEMPGAVKRLVLINDPAIW